MKRVVLLSQDEKASTQIKQWVKEISDDLELEVFTELKLFAASYFNPAVQVSPESDQEASSPESTTPKFVHTLILDAELFTEQASVRVEDLRNRLAAVNAIDASCPLSVMVMAFVAPNGKKSSEKLKEYRIDLIDDLVLKPLDRSLFLQKLEILVSGNPALAPSFLFKQKTDLLMEMGKETTIDRLSEFGFAIRNPAALVDGLYARAYGVLFGEGSGDSVFGRAYKNERHPEHPGEFLVYFRFFGITHDQLFRVRKFLKAQSGFMGRIELGSKNKTAEPEPIKKDIVIIDVDSESRQTLASLFNDHFSHFQIHSYPSYLSFLKAVVKKKPEGDAGAPAPAIELAAAQSMLTSGKQISLTIRSPSLELVETDPPLRQTERFLHLVGMDLKADPLVWMSPFGEDEKQKLIEVIGVAAVGRTVSADFKTTSATHTSNFLRIKAERVKAADAEGDAVIRLIIREVEEKDCPEFSVKAKMSELKKVDALFIDAGLISSEVSEWYANLMDLMRQNSLVPMQAGISVFVLGDERFGPGPKYFRFPEVTHFLLKPFDRRLILDFAEMQFSRLDATRDFRPCKVTVTVVKDVQIEELSEYGALVHHRDPLRTDSYMALFGSVLTADLAIPVWARCCYCAKTGDGKEFSCFFRFFGLSDETLARIRNWIREDYALKKDRG